MPLARPGRPAGASETTIEAPRSTATRRPPRATRLMALSAVPSRPGLLALSRLALRAGLVLGHSTPLGAGKIVSAGGRTGGRWPRGGTSSPSSWAGRIPPTSTAPGWHEILGGPRLGAHEEADPAGVARHLAGRRGRPGGADGAVAKRQAHRDSDASPTGGKASRSRRRLGARPVRRGRSSAARVRAEAQGGGTATSGIQRGPPGARRGPAEGFPRRSPPC